MKISKIVSIILSLVLCAQCVVFASETKKSEDIDSVALTSMVQPRGRYLMSGGCSITPHSGYARVNGYTDAYEDVDEIIVELTVFKEVSAGCWIEVWSDSATEYDTYHGSYTAVNISLDSGYYYKIEGKHTVKHNGVTETTYSETEKAYVY